MRKLIAMALAATTLGAAALPAAARVDIYVNVPPPAPRYEVVPAPRVGYAWVPGYWEWRHGHHFWVRGRWVHHRPGWAYRGGAWQERGGHWYYTRPGWYRP